MCTVLEFDYDYYKITRWTSKYYTDLLADYGSVEFLDLYTPA